MGPLRPAIRRAVLSIRRRPVPRPASTLENGLQGDIDDLRQRLDEMQQLTVHTAKALELLLIDVNAARRDIDSLLDDDR